MYCLLGFGFIVRTLVVFADFNCVLCMISCTFQLACLDVCSFSLRVFVFGVFRMFVVGFDLFRVYECYC